MLLRSLFLGGGVGLTGNLAPRHRYRTALTIEAAVAAVRDEQAPPA